MPLRRVGYLLGMGALYKPFGIIMGLLAGQIAKKLFAALWARIDDEEPPKSTTRDTTWSKLLAASAVQGVVFGIVKTIVTREGAKGFSYLTGTWPGEEKPGKPGVG